jgi:hypothetical protein
MGVAQEQNRGSLQGTQLEGAALHGREVSQSETMLDFSLDTPKILCKGCEQPDIQNLG